VASFRKKNNLWQAQVRSKYIGSISKSFHSKSDAQKWAKEQEVLMQSGQWSRIKEHSFTLHSLMTKYKNEITPKKRGFISEDQRLRRLLKEKDLMKIPLERLHPPYSGYF
jgi:hypothetical protein